MNNLKWTLMETTHSLGINPRSKLKITELPTIEYCGITICVNYKFDKKEYYNI